MPHQNGRPAEPKMYFIMHVGSMLQKLVKAGSTVHDRIDCVHVFRA